MIWIRRLVIFLVVLVLAIFFVVLPVGGRF
jgi:hypothetical protein